MGVLGEMARSTRIGKCSMLFIVCNCLICFLDFVQSLVANKQAIEYSEPSKCKDNEYFNAISLSCVQCDKNETVKSSADRFQCFYHEPDNRIFYSNATCKCNTNEILVDRNSRNSNNTLENNVCYLLCPNDTYPSLDRSKCFPCKNLDYDYYISHIYPVNDYYLRIQDHCSYKDVVLNEQNSITMYHIKFQRENIVSYYLKNELDIAIYFCKRKDRLACIHLSNMCALSLYRNEVACALFKRTQVAPVQIFYNKTEMENALISPRIAQKYTSFKDNLMNFTVTVFSLHGTLKSIGTPRMPCNFLLNVRFGINLKRKCKLAVESLLNAKVEFLTPYLTFLKNDTTLMHALPILIKNINENDNQLSTWQLVRKFFIIDNISSYKTLSNTSTGEVKKANKLSVLRYMKSLNIIINDYQTLKDKTKIFPVLLIIEYAELTREQIDETLEVTLDYGIEFSLKDSTIDRNLKISIGIFSGFALILSFIKAWSYNKYQYATVFNISILFWLIIYYIGIVGSVINLSMIIFSIYLFTFYKGQAVPYILLPQDINETTIKLFAIIAFSFKFIEILGFVYQYWRTDVILLDWEQPRTIDKNIKSRSTDVLVKKNYTRKKYKVLETPSELIAAKRKKLLNRLEKQNNYDYFDKFINDYSFERTELNDSIQERNKSDLPISIWRTYFIANYWLRLQAERKINVIVQLIAVLCTFQILQLYPWIFLIQEDDNHSFILYYTICTLIYISVYCIQCLISIAFYRQCIRNRMQEFVNLCSIANISVLILPFNYYGFYIHGRSVHGFADTDLFTLMSNFEKEKNNLCAHRGLLPGTTQQTFILSLTPTFRNTFNKISQPAKTGQTKFLMPQTVNIINWKQTIDNQLELKQLLCKFVDHCLKEEDYIIKEQHFCEKLLNILFPYHQEKSIFYIDNKCSFEQALLYGNEWLLATFEISLFTFVIVLAQDCILAITITILTSILLTTLVQHNKRRCLSNKVLLDKIFLM